MQNRREILKKAGVTLAAGASGGVAGCTGGTDGEDTPGGTDGEDTPTSTPEAEVYDLETLLAEDSLYIIPTQVGLTNNAWQQNNVNLDLSVTSFSRFDRALTTGGLNVSSIGFNTFLSSNNREDSPDLTVISSHLHKVNDILVRADSDIESPADLEGRKIGVSFWASATVQGMVALVQDEFGISLREDTQDPIASAPPVLWELLVEQEEIDAAVMWTGHTIKGYANPDIVKPIYQSGNAWRERTGHPLDVNYVGVNTEWLMNNPEVALNYNQGWYDAKEMVAEDPQDAYSSYGLLAGLSSEKEAEEAAERFENGEVHLLDYNDFNDEYVDSQVEFLNLVGELGLIDTGNIDNFRDLFMTKSELEELV